MEQDKYLSNQIIKLNRNFYFCTNDLLYLKYKSFQIKTYIVKTIIKDAIYIIEGSNEKFLKNQIMINEMINNKNDINLGFENLIQNKEKLINFSKLNFPLFFFNQGSDNQSYSIISNLEKNDREYLNCLKIKNIHVMRKEDQIDLPNYQLFRQIDFLKELKDILYLRNPVKNDERDYEYDLLSLEEIAGDYILTPDNYIKMNYLILRIYSNIPIVIFGEKGIGKYSMVKKITEFINNGSLNTITLEINSDTSVKSIIDFIEKDVIIKSVSLDMEENVKKRVYENNGMYYDPKKYLLF